MPGNYRLGCMLGDGIGPEIVPAARAVVDRALQVTDSRSIEWVDLPMGASAIELYGSAMPSSTKTALADCHGWLLGPHDSASYPVSWRQRRERVPGGELRHHFELFANIRPSRNRPGVRGLVSGVDIVTVRENTEGFYADRNMVVGSGEFMPSPDMALVVGVFTRKAIRRVAKVAFELASTRRQHVTLVHKSNVIPMAFGLFLDECRTMAEEYPGIEFDDFLFDAMAAYLVRHPQRFDVIVTENLFGDTLSDLTGELVGALGMSGSINAGESHAMAQAAHGSAPDIAGKGIANPVGMIISAAMLLQWLGERNDSLSLRQAAMRIDGAVDLVLASGVQTHDLGGQVGTAEFTEAVLEALPSVSASPLVGGRQ